MPKDGKGASKPVKISRKGNVLYIKRPGRVLASVSRAFGWAQQNRGGVFRYLALSSVGAVMGVLISAKALQGINPNEAVGILTGYNIAAYKNPNSTANSGTAVSSPASVATNRLSL